MKVSFLAVREKGSKNGRKFTINLWVLHCSQSSVITHGFERDPQTDTEVKQNTDVCIYIYICSLTGPRNHAISIIMRTQEHRLHRYLAS